MREAPANETIPALVIKTPAATPRPSITDKSCNVVIHGIKESPKGRIDRKQTLITSCTRSHQSTFLFSHYQLEISIDLENLTKTNHVLGQFLLNF